MKHKTLFILISIVIASSCSENKNLFYYEYNYITEFRKLSIQFPENIDMDSVTVDDAIVSIETIINPSRSVLYKNKDSIFIINYSDTVNYLIAYTIDSVTNEIIEADTSFNIHVGYSKGPFKYNPSNSTIQQDSLTFQWLSKTDTLEYKGLYGISAFCKKNPHSQQGRIFFSGRREIFRMGNEIFNCDIYIGYFPQKGMHSEAYFELFFIEVNSGIILKSETYKVNSQKYTYSFEGMEYESYKTSEENFIGRTYLKSITPSDLTPAKVSNWENCP